MNKWTTFVKEWAAKNNLSYGCAMTKPECKEEYSKANPKQIKTPKKRQSKVKATAKPKLKSKDVSYETLQEAMPTEAKKPINLKIKEKGIALTESMPTESQAKKPIDLKIKKLPKKSKISAAQKVFETPDLIREIASYKETFTDDDVNEVIEQIRDSMSYWFSLINFYDYADDSLKYKNKKLENSIKKLYNDISFQYDIMNRILENRLKFLINKNKLKELDTDLLLYNDADIDYVYYLDIGYDGNVNNQSLSKLDDIEIILFNNYKLIMKMMGISEENAILLLNRKLKESGSRTIFLTKAKAELKAKSKGIRLTEAIPKESQVKKSINLKIKELPKETPQKVRVTRIKINGTEYFISGPPDNMLFDIKTKEEFGIFDRVNNKILPLPTESEEEDEEEDEDDDFPSPLSSLPSTPRGRGIKKIKGGMIDKIWYSPTAMKEYATAIVKGRNDYQPKAREVIKKFGDRKIVRIYACRNPVQKLLTAALNAVSFGQFNKNWETQPYDDLFHLSLRVELDTQPQTSVSIEKTDAVTLTANPPPPQKSMECEFIPLNKEITLNQLLQGGEAFMGNKYFTYSAKDNNCQDYVMGLLRGSNIGTQENYDFIKQNTKELFKNLPGTRKISNTITDIGAVANVVIQGAGKKQKRKKDL